MVFFYIGVKQHKTFYAYGPAILAHKPDEYSSLSLYVNKVRPLVNRQCKNLFISWTGNYMDSGQISLCVHHVWEKAEIFTEEPVKKLCCNIIRKSTSTGLREIKSIHLQEVADLMMHSMKTANEHYYVRERQIAASKGSKDIREVYHGESCQSPPKHKWSVGEIATLQETYGHLLTQREVSTHG